MKKIMLLTSIAFILFACNNNPSNNQLDSADTTATSANLTPEEARTIAKETYIAMFPLVYNYGTMYAQAIEKNSKEYICLN